MKTLFDTNVDIQQDIYRNIIFIPETKSAFADLIDDKQDIKIAEYAVQYARNIDSMTRDKDFDYQQVIAWPFQGLHYRRSRYSDGSFPIWHGAFDMQTTLYETAYHSLRAELDSQGNDFRNMITKRRSCYAVFCQALCIDLRDKNEAYPELHHDDYTFTQNIGLRLKHEGHPGLVAKSVRCKGDNIYLMKQSVLSNPRLQQTLIYHIYPAKNAVNVYLGQSNESLNIQF